MVLAILPPWSSRCAGDTGTGGRQTGGQYMTVRQRASTPPARLIALGRSLLSGAALVACRDCLADRRCARRHDLIALALAIVGGAATVWCHGASAGRLRFRVVDRGVPLHYGLVTAVEEGAPPSLERVVAGVDWTGVTRAAGRRALTVPAFGVLVAGALFAVSIAFAPAVLRLADRVTSDRRATAGMLDVTVQVVPPAYTRRRGESFRNPPLIRALVGSELRVSVSGSDSVVLHAGETPVAADQPWRVGSEAVALRVRSGADSRIIAVDPVPDSTPAVLLRDAQTPWLRPPDGIRVRCRRPRRPWHWPSRLRVHRQLRQR
jgi:hypothetical protein